MTNTKLIVSFNDVDYEIEGITGSELKKQLNDISDISAIISNVTRSFDIPKTKHNTFVLGMLGFSGSVNYLAYNTAKCKLYYEGIPVVVNGSLFIKNSKDVYKAVIKEDAGNFFDLIEGWKINDLDLTDLIHEWNVSNITAYNSHTEGIIYPLINWGIAPSANNFHCEYLFPNVFVKTLFEKIFSKDYNPALVSEFRDWLFEMPNDYINLVMPVATQNLSGLIQNRIRTNSNLYADQNTETQAILNWNNVQTDYYGAIKATDCNPSVLPPFYANVNTYNVPLSGRYKLRFYLPLQLPIESQITIKTFVNDVEINTQTIIAGGEEMNYTETTIEFIRDFTINDIVYIYFQSDNGQNVIILQNAAFNVLELYGTIIFGTDFDVTGNMPDMEQKDLIKSVMELYCLIPSFNPHDNKITFVKFDDIINTVTDFTYQDLSDKLDISAENRIDNIENDFSFGSFGKQNEMKWAKDNNEVEQLEKYETKFILDNVNCKGNKEYIVSKIGTSLFELYGTGDNIYNVPLINQRLTRTIGTGETAYEQEYIQLTKKYNPKIFELTRQQLTLGYYYGELIQIWSGLAPIANPLDWEILKNQYYTNFIRCINQPDTPKPAYMLSVMDFVNLDVFKALFDKRLNGYYIILNTDNFNKSVSTRLNLLKIK